MDLQARQFCKLINSILHSSQNITLNDEVDWTQLARLAKEHNLLPIFMEEAVKYPAYVSHPEYGKVMQETMHTVAKQVQRTHAFLELYRSFVENRLYPIVIKGLICRQLYGDLCDHRPSGDEDILIQLAEYDKAKEILINNGYVTEFEEETEAQLEQLQEISFISPETGLHIELHLNIMGRENDARTRMTDYFADVFDNYREVEIEGVVVRTMTHQTHLFYLILHAFKHFTGGGFGIRQMLDILLYQEKYGAEIDLNKLHEELVEFKADALWNDLIHIGNLYLGFELKAFQDPNCPEELLEDMFQCGTFGNKTQAEIAAARMTTIATGDYLKKESGNSFVILLRTIFPSRAFLMNQFPYLEEKPWLLPVEWVKRWGRFLKRSRKNENNLAVESMKISQRRMKLLKKYGVV